MTQIGTDFYLLPTCESTCYTEIHKILFISPPALILSVLSVRVHDMGRESLAGALKSDVSLGLVVLTPFFCHAVHVNNSCNTSERCDGIIRAFCGSENQMVLSAIE